MKVEIWSDVVCPWCYIGKRRFEAALADLDEEVEIEWKSFQLDPTAPTRSDRSIDEILAAKYRMSGAQVEQMIDRVTGEAANAGLDFKLRDAPQVNTFDAHRLIQWAKSQGKGDEMKERLLAAHFTEGRAVVGTTELAELAGEVGLDVDQAASVLAGDEFADEVRRDLAEARQIGVTGVPFFLFDGKYAVPGAQPTETMKQVLQQVRTMSAPAGETCGADGCE